MRLFLGLYFWQVFDVDRRSESKVSQKILPVREINFITGKNITDPGTSFYQNLDIGLRQSPGIEIVKDGGNIAEIQPPFSTTQSRELLQSSNDKILME